MDLIHDFDHAFVLDTVCSEALLRQTYRLRYQVYCKELSFENPDQFPNEEEKDRWDERSHTLAVLDRETGVVAGSLRLITSTLPTENFPFEELCGTLTPNYCSFPRNGMTEVSRLTVAPEYRGSRGSSRMAPPFVPTSLFLAGAAFALCLELHHLYAVMDSRLEGLLASCGIRFQPISPFFDYKGQRAVFYIHSPSIPLGLSDASRTLFEHFVQRIAASLTEPTKCRKALFG